MKSLVETALSILNETFINLLNDDQSKKDEYKMTVWNILQKAYADIGGIKGSGFDSPDDMVKTIPFWKLAKVKGRVVAVALYKDKKGRKLVATGTDGSDDGKEKIREIIREDFKRSFGEKSKGALGLLMKTNPGDVFQSFVKTPKEVSKILNKDTIIPIKTVPKKDWPEDAVTTLSKYPILIDYGYLREIGGHYHFKVMFGTIGKSIK